MAAAQRTESFNKSTADSGSLDCRNDVAVLGKSQAAFSISKLERWIYLDARVNSVTLWREFARAHGMWTYEPRQGRNAATVVCSASAVVTLAFLLFDF